MNSNIERKDTANHRFLFKCLAAGAGGLCIAVGGLCIAAAAIGSIIVVALAYKLVSITALIIIPPLICAVPLFFIVGASMLTLGIKLINRFRNSAATQASNTSAYANTHNEDEPTAKVSPEKKTSVVPTHSGASTTSFFNKNAHAPNEKITLNKNVQAAQSPEYVFQ